MRLQANFSNNTQKLKTEFRPQNNNFEVNVNTSGSVIKDHNALNNRDMNDQHPIKAISGLQEVVDEVDKLEPTESITNEEIENILKLFV